jgi:O-antigen/teichoic acid export membrane protein
LKKSSIKRNTIANYIGQMYVMLIGIVVTPLYLEHLGAEAYGLVGFFALLQTWMNLLDIGLTPTLGRQIAHASGKTNGFDEFWRLLKSFELIF